MFYQDKNITLHNCDVMEGLARIPDESIQCVVTSPPYWGLRDYGAEGQLGLEKTPEEYIEKMVLVFREVMRVLKKDGTVWLNIGDSYCSINSQENRMGNHSTLQGGKTSQKKGAINHTKEFENIKPKDLVGIPWMLAFALRTDGWYLRQEIIWAKPNPMPESVTDRCTKSHESIFLLAKSQKYYFDADAIRTPNQNPADDLRRIAQQKVPDGWDTSKGKGGHGRFHRNGRGHTKPHQDFNDKWDGMSKPEQQAAGANKKSVWNVSTQGFKDAHFATFPEKLIEPCILAGSRPGDTILDPFWGSGTTGQVARKHGRKAIGIELNPEYCELSLKRFKQGVLF